MAWLGKVSLGGFPDLAGAVSKLSESVKNIEKNFDSALGLEENQNSSDEGPAKWPPASDNKGIFEPMMTFMGHKGQESASEASLKAEFLSHPSSAEEYEQISAAGSPVSTVETTTEKLTKDFISHANDTGSNIASIMVDKPGEVDRNEVMVGSNCLKAETETYLSGSKERPDSFSLSQHKTDADGGTNDKVQPRDCLLQIADGEESIVASFLCVAEELQQASDLQGSNVKNETEAVQIVDEGSPMKSNIVVSVQEGLEIDTSVEIPVSVMKYDHANELSDHSDLNPISTEQHQVTSSESVTHDTDVSPKSMEVSSKAMDVEAEDDKSSVGASNNKSNSMDPIVEVEKVKQEMKMMEAALQGAARQAQVFLHFNAYSKVSNFAQTNTFQAVFTGPGLKAKATLLLISLAVTFIVLPATSSPPTYHLCCPLLLVRWVLLYFFLLILIHFSYSSSIFAPFSIPCVSMLVRVRPVPVRPRPVSTAIHETLLFPSFLETNIANHEFSCFIGTGDYAVLGKPPLAFNHQLGLICCLDIAGPHVRHMRKDLEMVRNERVILTPQGLVMSMDKPKEKELKSKNAAKADEIAKLMNENERLKSIIEDLKRKSSEAEIDALREEYHQKVSSLERKIRELEEEKQRLNSKLQVEVTKVESIKRDKAATEKMLQETIERNQAELAAQKEFYTKALNEAKEAEAMAEARANTEARVEVESRLREAVERETMLVQTLKELRQSLTRTEQQAVSREEILQRDIEDLQKRYQASELHYTELITQVPKSTQPLLRQIEAMQETATRREEAWAGVERVLNSRLLEAEAKAAAAEEKERALNDRISQSLSRITVLETQISCIRAEQTQLSRSLEKERQRASESRQEYLAAMEEAATQEGRAKQLEDEIKEIRSEHKKELQDEVAHRELLEKELERLRTAQTELEKTISRETPPVANQDQTKNLPIRKLSSAGSLSSMDESIFLHTSLDFSDSFPLERRPSAEGNISPYFWKSMTQSAYEVALRQKDGELASYMSRLASLESVCNSLAEELVKMTEQCEKLRAEAGVLPGLRAELEALRQRHSTALELMGEHDEELEELQADIIDLKEMYREQVDLLVNRIQTMTLSAGAT
ncbi:TATA element modulatory factor 1 TATA binding [Musa troglodytarum]|uniref:TATA element modulatory factor 1 TATA binding n=1 Tax=Musa troglodytarum TaxID=320322 RepID=A0A9E7F433_9LILI|nr:TATA element modulatory factor 1 TATA binding [Musa troglodytarum]